MEEDLRTKQKGQILAVKDLPTLPGVLQEVAILVENPNSSTDQISKAISKDQVLSAKVLKMVNSPIYGFPGRIGSIQHALVLLGFNVVKGIIISTSVFDVMNENMKGLWEHSLGCALASSAIARAIGCKDPEEYAVAGLLHDIGKVVAAVQLPDSRAAIDALVGKGHRLPPGRKRGARALPMTASTSGCATTGICPRTSRKGSRTITGPCRPRCTRRLRRSCMWATFWPACSVWATAATIRSAPGRGSAGSPGTHPGGPLQDHGWSGTRIRGPDVKTP
jgi:hypothetical protein